MFKKVKKVKWSDNELINITRLAHRKEKNRQFSLFLLTHGD
jgi:hypothetical protein